LPHPLSKFAANGIVNDGPCADAVLEFIQDLTLEESESPKRKAASWFLLESDEAFFYACAGGNRPMEAEGPSGEVSGGADQSAVILRLAWDYNSGITGLI
jgi:hypothetical protein